MDVTFQHANGDAPSHESTVLRFDPDEADSTTVLIDSGRGVDPDALLGPGESFDAILLTHGHLDHCLTLGSSLVDGGDPETTPIYTSPATAQVCTPLLDAAQADNDIDYVDTVRQALEPVTDWVPLGPRVRACPVPVGHAPGAVGFVIRFVDAADIERYLLATGDFTARSCAGYPGLDPALEPNIEAVIANASTAAEPASLLTDVVETALERARGGSRVVVASAGLDGVHLAWLLAHVDERFDQRTPIRLVGQPAALYTSLDYDLSRVTATESFDSIETVLGRGEITICGTGPTLGRSAKRLFNTVESDPNDVFLEVTPESPLGEKSTVCTTRHLPLSNHPTQETLTAIIDQLAPKHLVCKHVQSHETDPLFESLDGIFIWNDDGGHEQVLYEATEWCTPGHIDDENKARLIRTEHYETYSPPLRLSSDGPEPAQSLPTPERSEDSLAATGVDLDRLESTLQVGGAAARSPAQSQQSAETGSEKATVDGLVDGDDLEGKTLQQASGEVILEKDEVTLLCIDGEVPVSGDEVRVLFAPDDGGGGDDQEGEA